MKKSDKINEILTIDLSNSEADIVWKTVQQSGFEQNLDGLKSFLLVCCGVGKSRSKPNDSIKFSSESVQATVDFLQNNPEVLEGAKRLVFNGLKNKLFGKR
jgi:hypothetical protein